MCDLVTSLLFSKTTNFELKEHPTTLTLSSLYFKTHPEGEDFVNPNMYIPQEMVYQPPKKTGVSLFVQRKPIKASKVCIMVKYYILNTHAAVTYAPTTF